ncbi:MAG: type I-C CRISPR-associated protein Cas7/Csd2 [Anaerolineae bacterium]|nr:type I-C CRISPR-associated protein Cas7/Csd2 [Chloroflexi bacterium CFX1]MCQ3947463.1 type I-C CRISPR-associated protein Cas7/Csd2 [Anaerolineae bacterium]
MATLSKKIDFAVIVTVNRANPNGDPLTGNRPRVTYEGLGEISDVAIKRKIRNRLMQMGKKIFVQSDDNREEGDPHRSLLARASKEIKADPKKEDEKYRKEACAKWLDVRAFGQVFPIKGETKGQGASIGIRGPVSIHNAFSVTKIENRMTSLQITKSVSTEGDGSKRGSDTMGMKHRVDHGVYVFYGAMNPQLASKTGFSDEDAEAIKEALRTLFVNDASSARPEGSMQVFKVYWWEHNSKNGQYSSAKVHRLLKVEATSEQPNSIEDYKITLGKLDGLNCEEIDGE